MKEKSIINQIKTLLGLQVKLEQMTLENGTVIEADSFEAGQAVFIVTEDGQVALPVGDYTLPDGKMLVVTEEGMIGEIKEAEMPEAEAPEAEVEVEVEASTEAAPEFVTKADFESALNEIKSMFSAIATKAEPKVELNAEPMPAAKAIKPNPEKEVKKELKFHQTKATTSEQRILAKISQIKK
jgi:hypothetical protein